MTDMQRFSSVLDRAQQTFGRSFDGIPFHAVDDNHMPVGAPLSANEYVAWLVRTYAGQSRATVQSIARQYDAAITSARQSPGILPEALATLLLSGEVFHYLAQEEGEQLQDVPLSQTVSSAQPQSLQTDSRPQKAEKSTDDEQLHVLRSRIIQELGYTDESSLEEIEQGIEERIQKHQEELRAQHLSPEMEEQELRTFQATTRHQLATLRSIEARLPREQRQTVSIEKERSASTMLTDPTSEHLDALKEEEARLVQEVERFEHDLENIHSSSQRIQHIRTQIQIVEQLLHIIEDETHAEGL